MGVVDTQDALTRAKDVELDLVMISGNVEPPVCKIMDFGKYLYEASKKKAAQKKKQKQIQVKEIRMRPRTEDADYWVKVRKIRKFLEEGNKVKVTVRFRGREMMHKDLGLVLLHRVETDLEEVGSVEQKAKIEGRQMAIIVGPLQS